MVLMVLLAQIILIVLVVKFGSLWLKAWLSGVPVSAWQILTMRVQGAKPNVVVDSYIMAAKAGLRVSLDELKDHFIAGGNVQQVVMAMASAYHAGREVDFRRYVAADLAGQDLNTIQGSER